MEDNSVTIPPLTDKRDKSRFGLKRDNQSQLKPTDGQVFAYEESSGRMVPVSVSGVGGIGAAPDTEQYVTLAASAALSNERVLTEGTGIDLTDGGAGGAITVAVDLSELAAGGELGGTLDAPTVDATHSGSTHSAATDTHIADTSGAHTAAAISILDTANDFTATDVEGALAELQADNEAHVAAADPHAGYVLETLFDALGDTLYASAADTGAKLAGNTVAARKVLSQTGNGSVSAAPAWLVLGRQMVIAVEVATAHATNTLGFVVWTGDACTMKFNLEFESPPTNLVAQVFELRRAPSGTPTSYSTIVTFSFTGNGSTVSYADSTSISVATGDRFVVRHTTGADTSGTRIRVIGLDQ